MSELAAQDVIAEFYFEIFIYSKENIRNLI